MIKKADIILFFTVLILGLMVSWLFLRGGSSPAGKVLVTVDGKTYGIYDIHVNQTIEIKQNGHTNNITIKDGTVSMTYSDCANQVCVDTGSISQSNDSIVCLPNKVMVEIVSEGGGADVITG